MRIINNDPNSVIKWRITDCCNFKCDYCIRKQFVNHLNGKEDMEKCFASINEVKRIINDLYKATGKKVKVDMIGGEISILPGIDELIQLLINEEHLEKINITSNFEQLITPNKKITFTASYHPTQTKLTMEEWFNRVKEEKDKYGYFKVETVKTATATHIDEFIKRATELGVDYQVEGDLFDDKVSGDNLTSKKANNRYIVVDDYGVVKEFATRNEFLKKHGIGGCSIPTDNMLCSRDYDYVYIEQDKVFLCYKQPIPIKDYKVVSSMHPCWRGNGASCTLCGNISVESIPVFLFSK